VAVDEHVRLTGSALKAWLLARACNALIVGTIWLVGLWISHVPWAPLWALLGAALQFIPTFGAMLTLMAAEFAALISGEPMHMIYVLILYAIIVTLDGLVLDPLLMKRVARVPIWASLLTPIVLGIIWPFWGVLIAAPLLAVVFTFRSHYRQQQALKPPV
jgi:predicted PurR-regulated permease PerM